MKRDYIDFSEVPAHQQEIHGRLENWGRWCCGAGFAQMSPMFRLYRSSDARRAYMECPIPVDEADAAKMAKGVIALPEKHRHSIHWYYVAEVSMKRIQQVIGCTKGQLALYVIDARQMMLNMRV